MKKIKQIIIKDKWFLLIIFIGVILIFQNYLIISNLKTIISTTSELQGIKSGGFGSRKTVTLQDISNELEDIKDELEDNNSWLDQIFHKW